MSDYGVTVPDDYDPQRDGEWDGVGADGFRGEDRYRGRADILAAVRAGGVRSRRDVVGDDNLSADLSEEQKQAVREWVADLESGSIPQGRGTLRRGNDRCCLAVALETATAVRNGAKGYASSWASVTAWKYSYGGVSVSSASLPDGAAELFGLGQWSDPTIYRPVVATDRGPSVTAQTGSSLNDVFRLSFAEIAEVLRAYYRDDKVWV